MRLTFWMLLLGVPAIGALLGLLVARRWGGAEPIPFDVEVERRRLNRLAHAAQQKGIDQ